MTATDALAPPRGTPNLTFLKGNPPAPKPKALGQGLSALLLRTKFKCEPKRFPEDIQKNARMFPQWVIVRQHVEVSVEDFMKSKLKKRTASLLSMACGPGVLLLATHPHYSPARWIPLLSLFCR